MVQVLQDQRSYFIIFLVWAQNWNTKHEDTHVAQVWKISGAMTSVFCSLQVWEKHALVDKTNR